MKKTISKLDFLKHTRPRESMGRPTIFKDKTKYTRKIKHKNHIFS